AARLHGVPVAGPAHGDRPALPAWPALQGDRAAPRRGFRGGEETPAARARSAAALSARQAALAATGERMNADPMSRESAREPWEVWSELDDTLADGSVDAPAEVPPVHAEARAWLANQRFVHGLLRAMQQSDAEAREARVAAILAAVRPPSTRR